MTLWKLVFSRSQGGTTCTVSPNKYGSHLIDNTCVIMRGRSCVVGRVWSVGRSRSCVVACGRAPSRPTENGGGDQQGAAINTCVMHRCVVCTKAKQNAT